MKLDTNTIITQAYHISRCSSWKLSSKARIAWAFIILARIQQGEKQKRCHPKSDYRLWQATHFSTKNPINKPAMNKRTLLIAAVFHFVHPMEKYSSKHDKLTQNSVSFSCQSKQLSRCCILRINSPVTASFPVVLGDFGCDVTCQACRENSPGTPGK